MSKEATKDFHMSKKEKDKFLKELLSGEALELYLELSSNDCTQQQAHKIIRLVDQRYEEAVDRDDFSDEPWWFLLGAASSLWGELEHWHTYDRRGF